MKKFRDLCTTVPKLAGKKILRSHKNFNWKQKKQQGAYRARFTSLFKNAMDAMFRQMGFNLFRGSKIILAT